MQQLKQKTTNIQREQEYGVWLSTGQRPTTLIYTWLHDSLNGFYPSYIIYLTEKSNPTHGDYLSWRNDFLRSKTPIHSMSLNRRYTTRQLSSQSQNTKLQVLP